MKIRRLGWAGLEISAAGESLVIDYVQDGSPLLNSFLTEPAPVTPAFGTARAALVSHLHEDHTDVPAIEATVGVNGLVLRPGPFIGTEAEGVFTTVNEAALAASDLDVQVVAEWETRELGPFTVTAVPAIDGLGDPQINWVVEAEGTRLFHGGDTLFHGYWWLIAGRLGPIDIAALPVNGAVVAPPHLVPASTIAACMGPEDAAQVAKILQVSTLIPIHFGVVWPGGYDEAEHPLTTLATLTAGTGVEIATLQPGETLDVPAI